MSISAAVGTKEEPSLLRTSLARLPLASTGILASFPHHTSSVGSFPSWGAFPLRHTVRTLGHKARASEAYMDRRTST
jgi:hypothetical protein